MAQRDGTSETAEPSVDQVAPEQLTASLEELQHWTWVVGRAQQLMLEHAAQQLRETPAPAAAPDPSKFAQHIPPVAAAWADPTALARMQMDMWAEGMGLWARMMGGETGLPALKERAEKDKRFADPAWAANPVFDLIRQSYLLVSERLLGSVDALPGIDDRQKAKLRFATQQFVDAFSPSNFPLTNPVVWQKIVETKGESLLKGLDHMLRDMRQGQLTQTDPQAFELGRNIATTPGKVVHQTPLYQLIQYEPATPDVLKTPLLIFPPWINRYYILDLNPKKSFIKWAVEQGLTVFVVSWKSADETMVETSMDDYVLAQVDAIETVRRILKVPDVHTIGYCVAGTYLAATLALLAARGEGDKVASATFFTAQIDFSEAGDLTLFIDDEQLELIRQLSADTGFLDGRYMAATFNLLRGRDLIWSYVVNNYLLGEDYAPFDLLHWNADTTNLPAKWHLAYLQAIYRDNLLIRPGGITIDGTPINLSKVTTPAYIQAGREDHIAPPRSVWKMTDHFKGPMRFVLAGSGHIAGVVNPPAAGKYQYWTNDESAATLDEFLTGAEMHPGSWWPDWMRWLRGLSESSVKASGARVPGRGSAKALEDAPGSYVRAR